MSAVFALPNPFMDCRLLDTIFLRVDESSDPQGVECPAMLGSDGGAVAAQVLAVFDEDRFSSTAGVAPVPVVTRLGH